MSKNVFRSGEIQFSETKVHISPPVLKLRLGGGDLQELDDVPAMPVYTVDDADTVETDDGISIEPLQPDGTYQAGAFAKWAGLFGRTRARAGLGLG